jgi:type IV pilus assembly protein PilA
MTLIELMIVVAIIGVIATVAIAVYRRHVSATKITEGKEMVNAIREAQERYKSERGTYADVSTDLNSLYPAAPTTTAVTGWGDVCSVCNKNYDWRDLNVHPTQPLRFGYATVADTSAVTPGAKGISLTVNGTAVKFPAPTGPWYVAVGYGAPKDQGQADECVVIGSWATNDLWVSDLCY